jgi:hypothetical protein
MSFRALNRTTTHGTLPRMSTRQTYRRRLCRLFSALSQLAGRCQQSISSMGCLRPPSSRALRDFRDRTMPAGTPALLPATGSLLAFLVLAIAISAAAGSQSATAKTFDDYIHKTEARMSDELLNGPNFLWIDNLSTEERSKAYEDLRAGRVAVENAHVSKTSSALPVPGGLIHDWKAIVFVPGVSLDEAIALLQDYNHDDDYFAPDVIASKLLSRDGEKFHVYLRLKRKYVVTAVFDTEYEVRYAKLNPTRAVSQSRSTRIEEIQNAGQSNEQKLAPSSDHGFLWRLNSYWRFEQANGGVFIQCEAISLSRDVPEGLGWAVKPFIEQIPRESLRFTLQAARAALLKKGSTSVKIEPGKYHELRNDLSGHDFSRVESTRKKA